MADRPILFSGPMVRALLAGTKTQTRRIVRQQPILRPDGLWDHHGYEAGIVAADDATLGRWMADFQRIEVRDRLYVREHWRTLGSRDNVGPRDMHPEPGLQIEYVADGASLLSGRFRQGMHMPRWVSRITLTVTDVRVERLQNISEDDAWAEGLEHIGDGHRVDRFRIALADKTVSCLFARDAYQEVWEAINGPGSWEANPWIAAYTFAVQHGNIDQLPSAAAA